MPPPWTSLSPQPPHPDLRVLSEASPPSLVHFSWSLSSFMRSASDQMVRFLHRVCPFQCLLRFLSASLFMVLLSHTLTHSTRCLDPPGIRSPQNVMFPPFVSHMRFVLSPNNVTSLTFSRSFFHSSPLRSPGFW